MKPSFNFPIPLSCMLLFVFLFSACDLLEDKEKSECDATEADEFTLTIVPHVKISYANGDDFYIEHSIKINVYKEHCGGNLSKTFTVEGEMNEDGWAMFPERRLFDFSNTKDKVYFTYTIIQGGKNIKHAQNGFTTTSEGRLLHEVKGEITYDIANEAYAPLETTRSMEMYIDWFERAPIKLPWNLSDVHFEDFIVN